MKNLTHLTHISLLYHTIELPLTLSSLSGDLYQDKGVADHDDDQWSTIEHDKVEDIVGQLVLVTRKEVEGDTLVIPGMIGMHLFMKDHRLE